MFLQLNHDSVTDIIWHVTESGASASGNVAVDQGGAFLGSPAPTYSYTTSGNEITVTYTYILDWDWTESTNIEYGVRATDASADSGYSFTNIDVQYENDLDFNGTLSVEGAQGALTDGVSWVIGGDTLTWSGLTVVFQGSSTSPASDTDYDIRITDDDGGVWTQSTVATLSLNTTSDAATDTSDVHNVDIINITPNGQDSSNVQFTVKVDATQPVVASADDTALNEVDVVFTDDHSGLDQTTAETEANYTVYDNSGACSGATTIGVSLAELSGNTVTLTLAAEMTVDNDYCVVVNTSVTDTVGNQLDADPNDRATFTASAVADETAPGVVSDLAVGTATTTGSGLPTTVSNLATAESYARGFLLSWGIPSDDGSTGVPSSYDVRFVDAEDYPASITSSFPWGSGDLQAAKEPTPGPSPTAIQLSWTAPGDDGSSGTATSYDVRYSTTGAITEANWSFATEASGEPSPPQVADSTEDFTVTGLSQSSQYWFAMKSSDDAANTSDLSNTFATGTGDDTDYFSLACAWNGSDNSTCSSADGENSLWPNTLYYIAIKSEDSASNSSSISNIVSAHTAMKLGYNTIGIPYDIASATSTFSTNFIDNVSSGGTTTPVIYKWTSLGAADIDPGVMFNGRWTRVSATAALNTESNGTGFYIYSWGSTDNVLDVDTGTVPEYGDEVDTSEDWVGITLTSGRNLISSPYLKNVNFSDIDICKGSTFTTNGGCSGGTVKDFANATASVSAVEAAWVDTNIHHFLNPTTATSEACLDGTDNCTAVLRPWWGQWVQLIESETIRPDGTTDTNSNFTGSYTTLTDSDDTTFKVSASGIDNANFIVSLGDLPSPTTSGKTISSVTIYVRAKAVSGSGDETISFGTTSDLGGTATLVGGFLDFSYSPPAVDTYTEVNSMEVKVNVDAVDTGEQVQVSEVWVVAEFNDDYIMAIPKP
jgi:hypothetical protein